MTAKLPPLTGPRGLQQPLRDAGVPHLVHPAGVMAACPDPLECVAPLPGVPAFCAMAGQLTPPPCATQEDCAAYEGTFCMDPLGLGMLGCVKSCTP
ncbi:MAG: hypothetical protein PVI30_26895 [Myxococcales bacterium]|jgi:hypothetical protein